MEILERIIYDILGGKKIETKLLRCQNYQPKSVVKWKKHLDLNWIESFKIFKAIEVFDGTRIRQIINSIVIDNKALFKRKNLFITSFGQEEKSGSQILYEFKHAQETSKKSFIEPWTLSSLPEGSTILFVDDIIGTGGQSKDYILDKLNLLLNPSHQPFLLTICATAEGKEKVETETNFEVVTGLILEESQFQHYSPKCVSFSKRLKSKLTILNNKLKIPGKDDFDKGLLITFYYSSPNNSMPILWKNDFPYIDNEVNKIWFAPLPRAY